MAEVFSFVARITLLFSLVYLVLRISGKKTISSMTAVDLMGVFLIAAMAAEPLVSSSAIKTSFGIGIVIVLQIAFGLLAQWNPVGPAFQQQPTALIREGKVDRVALIHSQIALEHLLSELRLKGYSTIRDVEYALLEPSGQVSVIPKAQARPVRPSDLGLPTPYEGLALPLILDGALIKANLKYAGLSEQWLQTQLEQRGFKKPAEVFLAELNSKHQLTVQAQPGQAGAFYPPAPGAPWHSPVVPPRRGEMPPPQWEAAPAQPNSDDNRQH